MKTQNTNTVQPRPSQSTHLDHRDRKILTLLSEDADLSYAELSKMINLSPPAIHERVKRLKQQGIIKATIALLDGTKLGRPLLAFVHVDTKNWAMTDQMRQLAQLSDIEEIHTVTGESAVLLKVRTSNTQTLETLLEHIHRIEGVHGTRTHIALSTYLERGPYPE